MKNVPEENKMGGCCGSSETEIVSDPGAEFFDESGGNGKKKKETNTKATDAAEGTSPSGLKSVNTCFQNSGYWRVRLYLGGKMQVAVTFPPRRQLNE
jgi:hypothetical protein